MRLMGILTSIVVGACSDPGTGTTIIEDATADSVFVPPDALFPVDSTAATDSAAPADTAVADTGADSAPTDTTVASDSAVASDTTSDTAVDTSVATDVSTCPAGAGCNDGDPCTINDHCEGGVCVGGGPTCSDALPCTTDTCTGGVCSFPVQAGTCAIDGVCWSPAQPNPNDVCQRCEPSKSTSAWTDVPNCGLGDPCEFHTDCYPERVCALWDTRGETVCSDPCAGAADCPSGQICSKLPGSAQVGYCQAPVAGTLVDAEPCTQDWECRSGLCTGVCASLCLDEAHCATPGYTCHGAGDPGAGLVTSVCSPDPSGSIPLGQVCSLDGGNSYDGADCASGHCDLTLFPAPNLPCAPLCKSETDCAPAQECNLVLYATTKSPGAVPYDPLFTERTYDALTACYNPGQYGPKQVGAPCTDRAQCGSNKCLGLIPGDPTMYCTTFCEHDAECPSGMACKLEVLNLVSTWLGTYPTISSQPGVQTAWTFVRVCKFE